MNTVRLVRAQGYFSGQRAAMTAVQRAIRAGGLSPASAHVCVDCGAPAQVYDHRDYNKPLDVSPVCRPCNALRGPAKAKTDVEPAMIEKTECPDQSPTPVSWDLVEACASYRAAVNAAWALRRNQRMTKATLSEMTGIFPAHVTDFVNDSYFTPAGAERREMPVKFLHAFERAVGNTLVSQWIAHQSGWVTCAERKAA